MSEPSDRRQAEDAAASAPEITFDGRAVPFRQGQTVGAALMAAGVSSWRTTRREGRERGLFCGIGVCFDCLVTVDGQRVQRACLTTACDGQQIRSEDPEEPRGETGHE